MMDNTEIEELARQAVSLPGWRWLPGLRIVDPHGVAGFIVLAVAEAKYRVYNRAGLSPLSAEEIGACLPDLTHSGVGGILLEMLKPVLHLAWFDTDHKEWCVELEPSEDLVAAIAPHLAEACALAAVGLGGWPEAQDA